MKKDKKKIVSISILVVGLVMLVVGVAFLIFGLIKQGGESDGEYLVERGTWTLEDSERVVWEFKEDGKGTLTTNDHANDYDFTWSLQDGKMTVKTDWLYELSNEYEYELDQGAGALVLTDDEGTYRFVAE